MSAGQWLLLVGMRVLDIGLLVAWLVWFFRFRDDGDDDDYPDDGGRGGEPRPAPGPRWRPSGPGRKLPHGRRRTRSHRGRVGSGQRGRRREHGVPPPAPSRVRRPPVPAPVHTRG